MFERNKKADVPEHLIVLEHVGILFNRPPGSAETPFNQSSNNFDPRTENGIFRVATREDSAH
jgi:hypothetical protein